MGGVESQSRSDLASPFQLFPRDFQPLLYLFIFSYGVPKENTPLGVMDCLSVEPGRGPAQKMSPPTHTDSFQEWDNLRSSRVRKEGKRYGYETQSLLPCLASFFPTAVSAMQNCFLPTF